MGRPAYSDDLRSLVVSEVKAGASRRAAAERFRVSASSAIRWVELQEETGTVSPRRRHKSRSPLEAHASWLLELVGKEPDLTLAEIQRRLSEARGLDTTDSSLDRFFKRHGVSYKKKESPRRRARST
jgi:transposase